MESILGRPQFLSETANLFTDEKTATARAKVVEWLNELPTVAPQPKCELVAKVQETIFGSCIELLDEFLDHILSLAHDTNSDVRKQIICFMEQICKSKVDLLPQVINVVSMLLRDRSPQVIKRIIQACGSIYRNGLQWICTQTELTDSMEQAWNVLSLVKAQVLDMIDNDNDGIRTNAIKFLEGIVVLQSYPDEDSQKKEKDFSLEDVPETLKQIKRQKLEEEALNIFDILLKFHAATHISSVNLITCTSSLCTIAKMRPSLMGPVVDAFEQLNSNLPPTLTDSQVSSVRKSLKMQLVMLLKNRASFEFHSTIRHLLFDLGATQGEVMRAIPRMDKHEVSRRQKRLLENASNSRSKRMRLNNRNNAPEVGRSGHSVIASEQPMEVDEGELEKQRQKSTRVNEKFLAEHLRSADIAVKLIIEFLPMLPAAPPAHFLEAYSPIRDMSLQQQVAKVAKGLGEQMTAQRIGPGAAAFTKEPPMRPKRIDDELMVVDRVVEMDHMDLEALAAETTSATTPTSTGEPSDTSPSVLDEEELRKEEATKKLRENMERLKGEQELIERMKQRVKTLKLQEVTKPIGRPLKEKFLLDAVKRILYAERQCIVGGMSARRRKLLTVMAATFPDNVRYFIFEFIMQDIKQRIDLAFSWLYEEYCLLQGFTRHSYVKSENRPDHAYNELIAQIIAGVRQKCEHKDKIVLLRRLYLEAPLLPEQVINELVEMCFVEEFAQHCLDLMRDMVLLRPPRRGKFLRVLLTFCVHERADLRERALQHIVVLYDVHKVLPQRIEDFAMEWVAYLEREIPPAAIFTQAYGRPQVETQWKEETAKICITLLLTLMPYKTDVCLKKLCEIYVATSAELKRTILRSIDAAIKKLGADNIHILKLIDDCPKGTETLIIRIIYILTERAAAPPAQLVQHVRDLYTHQLKDVRVLIPIMGGLTRTEILGALPKLLKLNQVVVKEVFNRLLGIGGEFTSLPMATTPTDVLVALHTIDPATCDLKCIVKATALCLGEREIYTHDVLIGVLQQLVEVVPLPTLLMRTIIQSLTLYPRLANFVLNLLQRLILKQVWRQKVIWEGFLKCVQRLKPTSLAVLLNLPAPQLLAALQQCPDLRSPLLEYADSIKEEPMSGITPQILDIISGKAVDVFVTDESGGYISVDNIKKEVVDSQEVIMGIAPIVTTAPLPVPAPMQAVVKTTEQPLPPGED